MIGLLIVVSLAGLFRLEELVERPNTITLESSVMIAELFSISSIVTLLDESAVNETDLAKAAF